MCSKFTDSDVGKRVETAAGETIGVVTMTGDETAYVDVEEGITDSMKAVLDWSADTDNIVPIGGGAVREVTADVVRLEGETAPRDADEDGTDPVIERNESTVHEDEGVEQRAVGAQNAESDATDDETAGDDDKTAAAGEGRSGEAVEPETDSMTESGEERHPESEDQPPQGDRTVTKDRGEEEDR